MAATTATPWPADIDPSTWSSAPAAKGADTEAVRTTTAFVQKAMADNDASHDWAHISRVRNTALALAVEEGKGEDVGFMEMVELAALLHDVSDWKYAKEGVEQVTPKQWLDSISFSADKTALICATIDNMGFKESLARSKSAEPQDPDALALLGVVQDADRLDAIGAIGIARCLTYGGAKKRPLFDPEVKPLVGLTKEQYMAAGREAVTVNHFYEKLFTLADRMNTAAGARVAAGRHEVMVGFIRTLTGEWRGAV